MLSLTRRVRLANLLWMKLPSPSKLSLAYRCAHPFTSGIKWPWEPDSSFSGYGKAVHKVGELLGKNEPIDIEAIAKQFAITDDEKKRLVRDGKSIEQFLADRVDGWAWLRCEIILCYDTVTGEARTIKEFRERRQTEILGIADLMAQRHDGTIDLIDWKTGAQRHTGEATNNPQLSFLALCAARMYNADSATVGLAYIDDNGIWNDVAELDGFAIDAAEEELKAWIERNSHGPTPPVPGPHCTRSFCPLVGICSATRAALAQAATPFSLDLSDDAEAKRVLRLYPLAEAALEKVKKALDERARQRAIPLGDGMFYGIVEHAEDRFNNLTVDDEVALFDVLGPGADDVIKRTSKTTKASISDLVASQVRGGKRGAIRAAKEAVFATLKAKGLMKESKIQMLKEYKKS